jgi:hypothetical protein
VLTKSSGGTRGLGDRTVEDDGDTCRDCGGGVVDTLLQGVWWFGPQNHRRTVFRFGPQNLVGVLAGTGGGTWSHREACIEAKQSREEHMDIGGTNLELHVLPLV